MWSQSILYRIADSKQRCLNLAGSLILGSEVSEL